MSTTINNLLEHRSRKDQLVDFWDGEGEPHIPEWHQDLFDRNFTSKRGVKSPYPVSQHADEPGSLVYLWTGQKDGNQATMALVIAEDEQQAAGKARLTVRAASSSGNVDTWGEVSDEIYTWETLGVQPTTGENGTLNLKNGTFLLESREDWRKLAWVRWLLYKQIDTVYAEKSPENELERQFKDKRIDMGNKAGEIVAAVAGCGIVVGVAVGTPAALPVVIPIAIVLVGWRVMSAIKARRYNRQLRKHLEKQKAENPDAPLVVVAQTKDAPIPPGVIWK